MNVITKIGRQKNNQERYNIYINEKYSFAVDEGTLIKFGLMKGKVLEQFDIDEIVYEDEISKAFNKGLQFLSFQMRSEYEVRQKLKANEFGEAVIEEAIRKLEKLGFLNDETYSVALMETKRKTAKKGPRAILQDLTKKGVNKELQKQVIAEYSHEDQVENALALADKLVRSGDAKTPAQVKQKIQDLLMRKGYSFSIVSEVLDQIELTRDDEQWSALVEKQGDKLWSKYASKYSGSELYIKVKQGLYQKGFPVEIINGFIEGKKEND